MSIIEFYGEFDTYDDCLMVELRGLTSLRGRKGRTSTLAKVN